MADDRVLGWDDEISNDTQSTLFQPGEYAFEVVSLTRGRHTPREGGQGKLPACPKAEIMLRCYSADGAEYSDIKTNLFLHSRCEGMLCSFFRAIGQRKHGEPLKPNWDTVVGSRGVVKLGVREYEVDGEKRHANEVKSFPERPAKQTPVTPPQKESGF